MNGKESHTIIEISFYTCFIVRIEDLLGKISLKQTTALLDIYHIVTSTLYYVLHLLWLLFFIVALFRGALGVQGRLK